MSVTLLNARKLQFRVLQGSVETLFRWSEKYLYRFVTNLFKITCAKFYKNWLSFVDDITKTILVYFYGTQCSLVLALRIEDNCRSSSVHSAAVKALSLSVLTTRVFRQSHSQVRGE